MASRRSSIIALGPPRVWWVLSFLLLLSPPCYSADVVFIRSPRDSPSAQEQLEVATSFYGVNLKIVTATSPNDDLAVRLAVSREETVGVVIAPGALVTADERAVVSALRRRRGGNAPLLILGVSSDLHPSLFRTWSGGIASGCGHLEGSRGLQYLFGRVEGLTSQLADVEIPLSNKDVSYILMAETLSPRHIASIRSDNQVLPTFIEAQIDQQEIFVACSISPDERISDEESLVAGFLRDAPAIMFVKHCAGERGWHAPHHYANFTIDDPWLRQPYGYVDYRRLLEEMERHSFHTTIAFIPWNYDRSQPEVVSLFRNNPQRFSIAVHGNNHNHKEFGGYQNKSLASQVGDLKQALGRMEKFRTLTGIRYDKVMIFPHSIAPEETLEALKTYNYLGTVNSSNVPEEDVKTSTRSTALRPVTLSFAGFPSIIRYSVAAPIPKGFIAISQFLDNPLLFYGHADFFAKSIDAFDNIADEVNELNPDTQWRSLGEIMQHLYVEKLRDDSNYDVAAFSNNFCVENGSMRNSTFYARKLETGGQAIASVTVDGKVFPYKLREGFVDLAIPVARGNARCVAIQFANDLQLDSIDISHDSFVVYALRMASDFRDIYLSRSSIGLAVIRFYNEHQLTPAHLFTFLLLFIAVSIYTAWRLRVLLMTKGLLLRKTQKCSPAD